MNYYIADTHFGHTNILKFDNRPFESVKEMNEALIHKWNDTVKRGDTVYILGDFCWGKANEWADILRYLSGNKVLIKGNHDLKEFPSYVKCYFNDIKDYKEIKENGRTVLMSHYPIMCYKRAYDPNVFMLHGHTHTTREQDYVAAWTAQLKSIAKENQGFVVNRGNIINVGCMMPWMEYRPKTLDEILAAKDN